ncbi:transposase [Streptomyces sp. IBSBF 2806]|uniref:transposase n=1 Tax=Streptomyces sp. IBSBF 2806 TaxID=2903529 RepID=UPI003FA6F7BA
MASSSATDAAGCPAAGSGACREAIARAGCRSCALGSVQGRRPRPGRARSAVAHAPYAGKFRTGTAWRDVPERHGPWHTLPTRFRRWALDGAFERMLQAAQSQADAAGDIDWLVQIGSPVVRAHRHAAGLGTGAPQPCLGLTPSGLVRPWGRQHGCIGRIRCVRKTCR